MIIKATELRIGNYLVWDNKEHRKADVGKIAKLSSIDGNRKLPYIDYEGVVGFTTIEDKYEDSHSQFIVFMKPILLTEEWLERFGFEFWCDELGIKAYYKVYGIEYFCVATNGFYQLRSGLKTYDGCWRLGNNYPFIKYVHQLQNLYFALTGEELTIKENDN